MDKCQISDSKQNFSLDNKIPKSSSNRTIGSRPNDFDGSFDEVFRSSQSSNQGNVRSKSNPLPVTRLVNNISVSVVENQSDVPLRNDSSFAPKETLTELSTMLKNNNAQHCPICYKRNTFDQTTGFIAHLKACAAKNKISTDQLIKAVQLIEKQSSEMLALGLPRPITEKTTVKKSYSKKTGMDTNMQLAMALSVSLRESEMMSKLQETETLLEAGLEQEAMVSCKQLEDFGFKTSKASDIKIQKTSAKSKERRNTVLFTRTQSERERIITEKIAIILIDSNEQCSNLIPPSTFNAEPKSKFLLRIYDKNFKLWKKSYQLDKESSNECYYVMNLSSIISPCKIEAGSKLKHLSQIPCRNLSTDENHFSRSLEELVNIFGSPSKSETRNVTPKKESFICRPIISKAKTFRLSSDWKSLVNKTTMSDITIYVKNERLIYAHKLVFYVRCSSILTDIIKESENDKITEIIMWMEFCFESVIAFLEFIYSDDSSSLKKLDECQLANVRELCTRYHVNDFKEIVEQLAIKDEPFVSNAIEADVNVDVPSASDRPCTVKPTESSVNFSTPFDDGEKNLMFLQMALKTQNEEGRTSPEMFGESDSFHLEENTDDDFSLTIHDSAGYGTDRDTDLDGNILNTARSPNPDAFRRSPVTNVCNPIEDEQNISQKSNSTPLKNAVKSDQDGISANSVRWTCDTDIICLSDDDILESNRDNLSHGKENGLRREKRKSPSPLLKSPAKKEKMSFMKAATQRGRSNRKHHKHKLSKKRIPSQPFTLSDSLESSDSDESLCKFDTNKNESIYLLSGASANVNSPKNMSKPLNGCRDEKVSVDKKLKSCDSSFELDDFRNLKPERHSNEKSFVVDSGRDEFLPLRPEQTADAADLQTEDELPYISPIWDGFEAINDYCYGMNYSPGPNNCSAVTKNSTPLKNLLTKNLASHSTAKSQRDSSFQLDEDPKDIEPRASSRLSFEPFSIDESVLEKLEKKAVGPKTPVSQSQMVTPSNVRKFKARSKSDTFLTPSPRNNGGVTPIAEYSGMRTGELKKELERYGIKPGLGKRKAKQLLRHIYDQLHPPDDEATPKRSIEVKKIQKPAKRFENSSRPCTAKENSADSDDSSDSFASGIDVLESSFVDDVNQNQENVEDTKSQKLSLDMEFRKILHNDQNLYNQILLYEPIWLEELKGKLKEQNVKCSSLSLMNYLDEKCITFRTQQQKRVHKKRKKIRNSSET